MSAMKKDQIGQETAATFNRVVKKGIFEGVPCERGLRRSRAAHHAAIWEKTVLGRRNSASSKVERK